MINLKGLDSFINTLITLAVIGIIYSICFTVYFFVRDEKVESKKPIKPVIQVETKIVNREAIVDTTYIYFEPNN